MTKSYFQDDEIIGRFYDGRLVQRMLPYLLPYWAAALTAILFVIGGMSLYVLTPWMLGQVVDHGLKPRDAGFVERMAWLYGLVTVLVFVCRYAQNYLLQYVGQKVMHDLRHQVFSHLQRLPVRFFDRNPVGRLVTRTTNDVATLAELFSAGIVVVIGDLFLIVGVAVALVLLQPTLGLATLGTVPLLVLAAWYFQGRIRTTFREVRSRIARVNATLSENLSGMKIIQAFHRERDRETRFDSLNAAHRDAQLESVFNHSMFVPVITMINALTIAIVLLLGGKMVMGAGISLGVLVSFLAYAQEFFHPIRNLSEKVTVFQSAMASAERIFGLLDETEEEGITGGTPLDPAQVRGEIRFENVRFSYNPGEPVLEDISFHVPAGRSVAIVGHTGAGKTTIASLLNRFYEIDSGRIFLDGHDIRTLGKDTLRRCLAVIQQDVFIFSGTFLENIRLDDPGIPPAEVEAVARQIEADTFIRQHAGGFDAEVYERGANLSAGQRQLLSFARALCARPKILILDEATSSIDSETEKIIQRAIAALTRDRTCLIIAHRLSTIQHCDRILVLHKGRLVEEGSHEELLAKRGTYHKLHELQFKGEQAGA